MPFVPDAPAADAPGRFVPDKPAAPAAAARAPTPDDIPGSIRPQEKAASPFNPEQAIKGAAQAGRAVVQNSAASAVGNTQAMIEGLAKKIVGSESKQSVPERAGELTDKLSYQPGKKGGEYLEKGGKALESTKLGGLGPAEAGMLGQISRPPVGASNTVKSLPGAAADAVKAHVPEVAQGPIASLAKKIVGTKEDWQSGTPKEGTAIPGGGSAMTPRELQRRTTAANMDVPIEDMTKGQATGAFDQLQYEKEMAKNGKLGGPLRERVAAHNEKLFQNIGSWFNDLGAKSPNLYSTGNVVDDALVARANKAKQRYQTAYGEAEAAGELRQPVSVSALTDWINKNRSWKTLAPVIGSAEDELVRLGGATRGPDGKLVPGKVPLNDLEKLRRDIIANSKADGTSERYGSQANKVIDDMTEGAGGDVYKRARRLYSQYATEFKNQSLVNKIMSTKKGSNDRKVGYENVADAILTAPIDEARGLRRTLQKEGPDGHQAWTEIQGAALKQFESMATSKQIDSKGNPIFNVGAMKKWVDDMDAGGKLEFMFGKTGAQKIRDLRDVAEYVQSAPVGSVNYSNTSSALKNAMSQMALGHLPTGIKQVVGIGADVVKNRKERARIQDSLEVPKDFKPGQIPPPP